MSHPRDKGFQYGRGWGCDPKPPFFLEAVLQCRKLNEHAIRSSNAAWQFEMKIKKVRIACTGEEKAIALRELREHMDKLNRDDIPIELPPPHLWSDG